MFSSSVELLWLLRQISNFSLHLGMANLVSVKVAKRYSSEKQALKHREPLKSDRLLPCITLCFSLDGIPLRVCSYHTWKTWETIAGKYLTFYQTQVCLPSCSFAGKRQTHREQNCLASYLLVQFSNATAPGAWPGRSHEPKAQLQHLTAWELKSGTGQELKPRHSTACTQEGS